MVFRSAKERVFAERKPTIDTRILASVAFSQLESEKRFSQSHSPDTPRAAADAEQKKRNFKIDEPGGLTTNPAHQLVTAKRVLPYGRRGGNHDYWRVLA